MGHGSLTTSLVRALAALLTAGALSLLLTWWASPLDERSSGHEIPGNQINDCFTGPGPVGDCLAPDNLHVDYTYQPARNYWPLQWIETGIYLALAALLGSASFWRIRRHRD